MDAAGGKTEEGGLGLPRADGGMDGWTRLIGGTAASGNFTRTRSRFDNGRMHAFIHSSFNIAVIHSSIH